MNATSAQIPDPETGAVDELFAGLERDVAALRATLVQGDDPRAGGSPPLHPVHESGARNLRHYLALRSQDLRPLQMRLAAAGLSSLGRAESDVLAGVDAVLRTLRRLTGNPDVADVSGENGASAATFGEGRRRLARNTEALLGPAPVGRAVRILVTMPAEAADDGGELAGRLPAAGMDCVRVNCAHDGPAVWGRILANVRRAERATGRRFPVLMDLAGPKLRTGPTPALPAVARLRPARDEMGRTTAPALVWLTDSPTDRRAPDPACVVLPVGRTWLESLQVGDEVRFRDTTGAKRRMRVVGRHPGGCLAECGRSAWLAEGVELHRRPKRGDPGALRRTKVAGLPRREGAIRLSVGDRLLLAGDTTHGRPATRGPDGKVVSPAVIGCTLPEALRHVRKGAAVRFDDGRIDGEVVEERADGLLIAITRTPPGGAKLASDKGINFPGSDPGVPALTAKDETDLDFIVRHADVVALSFVNRRQDVERLAELLAGKCAAAGRPLPGVVLKIETRQGFERLPELLPAVMRFPACGVMIARGDLAVECGFERMAEVQEEILWLCEAARVPVIWATQVLESLAKQGMPSRAEITDAAMGNRAECVMLNKGPHVTEAVAMLDDILRRMASHQDKKRAMLRELRLATRHLEG